VQNLKLYSRDIDKLILWLDCDREGEAIAYDIIDVIQANKPQVDIWRAKFSAVTRDEVTKAMDTLVRPDKALADAVRVRQEVDLRIGASFTRF
jgi:DNA topoisomerase III